MRKDTHNKATSKEVKTIRSYHEGGSSHGVCLNLGHYDAGRIEIRLAGGQSSFGAFRNTMEVVFHIVDAVKRLSWKDCDDVKKIFNKCNYHVLDRLGDCYDAQTISRDDYEAIKENADMVTRYI